jgi:hypothetical protein
MFVRMGCQEFSSQCNINNGLTLSDIMNVVCWSGTLENDWHKVRMEKFGNIKGFQHARNIAMFVGGCLS